LNDFQPYIYKTTNSGKSWSRIDKGIPDGAFVRVVREDPVVKGMLYAGTEKGMFVSYNDGGDWQSLDLNLPAVPVTDLRAREDGLVLSTQGRAFWVLDDLFVLRQAKDSLATKAVHIFSPPVTAMGKPRSRPGKNEGANPSPDVPLYYFIKGEVDEDTPMKIEILDAGGAIVRTMDGQENDQDRCKIGNMDPRRPFELKYPKKEEGLNRWGWNMAADEVKCIDDIVLQAGYDGPSAAPGKYTARITVGGVSDSTDFEIVKDPRSFATDAQIREWAATTMRLKGTMDEVLVSLDNARKARTQIKARMAANDDPQLQELGEGEIADIDKWEALITQLRFETYEDEDAWATMLDGQLRYLMDVIDDSGAPVTDGAKTRMGDLARQWQQRQLELNDISENYISPINRWAGGMEVDHVLPLSQ
ncbi:MAG: hypothetical protein KDI09_20570, partial [Halioglobus sp.]|nr:hypothetical protein [Halioglobus sp.]